LRRDGWRRRMVIFTARSVMVSGMEPMPASAAIANVGNAVGVCCGAHSKAGSACVVAIHSVTAAPLGATPLDKLRKTNVDELVVKLRNQGLSSSTVR
jgi:hypothetical protein